MTNNGIRWDHNLIFSLVEENSSVLDLGCGNGDLLAKLIKEKNVSGQAVEANSRCVAEAIRNGVAVYQKNIDHGLSEFKSKSFDYVILEKTLQQVQHPLLVLEEILRIGETCIVSFPNFNYRGLVEQLLKKGRMPVSSSLPYQWYDTPNIHLFTLADFMDWTGKSNTEVVEAFALTDAGIRPLQMPGDSRAAEELLFVIRA